VGTLLASREGLSVPELAGSPSQSVAVMFSISHIKLKLWVCVYICLLHPISSH
jgi:hypothetical protein